MFWFSFWFTVIYNFNHKGAHKLQLQLGETVQIHEENGGNSNMCFLSILFDVEMPLAWATSFPADLTADSVISVLIIYRNTFNIVLMIRIVLSLSGFDVNSCIFLALFYDDSFYYVCWPLILSTVRNMRNLLRIPTL